jgi:hypothetical protein
MMLDAVPVADWRVKYAVRQATAILICRRWCAAAGRCSSRLVIDPAALVAC